MPSISSLADLGTSSVEYAIGFGLGVALGNALGPLGTTLSQEAYSADQSRALAPQDAARIVAQELEKFEWGKTEAAAGGINPARFALLNQLEVHTPALGEVLDMVRRSTISGDLATHALRKAQLDDRYDAAVLQLANRPLDGAEIANAIHRGNMDAPSIFPFPAPTTPGRVPQYPLSKLDPFEQASWSGTSREQLAVLVANAGLPLGLVQMLQLYNRGSVTADDVKRAIAHSNLRNEYMDVALDLARYILSPTEYAELNLRGWIDTAAMHAGGALHGVETADMDLLFKLHGRPIPVHQVTTGIARGGSYNGPTGDIPEAYLRAMQQGSSRPEWYNLEYANRYTIPSYFVLKQILADGGITEAELADYFKQEAYPPDLAEKAAKAIAGGTGAKGDPYVTKAETTAWTTAQRTYIAEETTAADVSPIFDLLAIPPESQTQVLKVWDEVRKLTRNQLTPKEVKKAIGQPGKDEAWALQQLLDRGYSRDDAQTFLAE